MKVPVSSIVTGTDPRQWAVFERQKRIHQHITENGMQNPIVVNSSMELQFGGCRLQFAVLNDWDEIAVLVEDDLNNVRRLQYEQARFEQTFLPEHLIELKENKQ